MTEEWKRVADGLPKIGAPVDLWIVAKDCEFRAPDFIFSGTEWITSDWDESQTIDRQYGNVGMQVTHWRPVPKPPEGTPAQ